MGCCLIGLGTGVIWIDKWHDVFFTCEPPVFLGGGAFCFGLFGLL